MNPFLSFDFAKVVSQLIINIYFLIASIQLRLFGVCSGVISQEI